MKLITLTHWADVLLEVLECSSKDKSRTSWRFHDLALSHFNPVEPFLDDDTPSQILISNEYKRGFFMDVTPSDIEDWDISLMCNPHTEDTEDLRFSLIRFRRIPLKVLRGVRLTTSWTGEMSLGFIKHSGAHLTGRAYLAWVNQRWQELSGNQWLSTSDEVSANAQMILGIAFTRYYEWTVTLGRESGISIRFVTDPEGAREAFRLRDIPEGKDRRTALRNWIMEHWRKKRSNDKDKTIKVRQHLRGTTSFNWNGLICGIVPSAYDIQQDELLRSRREAERQQAREWAAKRYGSKAYSWE